MMETVRLRLVFYHILTKSHKTQGLHRCWILLKPQHKTISDLSSYLLHAFNLQTDCPRGLILSMEGFALPPFESTSILKDKDIIRVEKNGGVSSEIVMLGDEGNSLDVVEIVETQPVAAGMTLLANEEFEKESGGYQSEQEEDAPEQARDTVQLEDAPEVKKVSKKRKALKELKSSKRKKTKSDTAEKHAVPVKDIGNNVSREENGALSTAKIDERSKSSKALPNRKRLTQPQENGNRTADKTFTPSDTNKLPSRSARRKKAKRKWLREKLKAERKEQYDQKLLNGSDLSSQKDNQIVFQKSSEKGNCEVSSEVSESDDEQLQEDHQQPDQDSDAEDDQKLLNGSDLSSQKDNQMVFQKSSEKGNCEVSSEVSESDDEQLQEDHQQPDQDSDAEDDVVPVVVRPGHIRFEPLKKVGTDQAVQRNQIPLENFQWNGITSKKKGQKWGIEKVTSNKEKDYKNANEECSRTRNYEARSVFNYVDFEKLEFYASLPKEGDVIAYRLIELSSSWSPELSSYRVGKISRYDIESNRVQLVQVPEYPMIHENGMGEDTFAELSETSSYEKDGSLWVDFTSLVEVRLITRGNFNSEKPIAGPSDIHDRGEDAETGFKSKNGNEAHASVQVQENGEVNAWEEIKQALKAKKEQLSQEDNWNQPQSTGRRPWSYKALRGSALGPTMALLRARNEL